MHLAHVDAKNPEKSIQVKMDEEKKKKEEEQRLERVGHTSSNFADIFLDIGTGGSKDAALVIFAIVGLVVVVAWIPYVPILVYDALTGDRDKFQFSHLLTIQGTPIIGGEESRSGSLLAGRYAIYIEEKERASSIKKGLGFEAGYYLSKEEKLDGDQEVRNEGAYWLIGPSLMVGEPMGDGNTLFARLDLMGGTSFDSDLGLVTKAEFSGNWLFKSGFTMGLGIGGLYLHVKDDKGVLDDSNDIALTFSGIFGYAF